MPVHVCIFVPHGLERERESRSKNDFRGCERLEEQGISAMRTLVKTVLGGQLQLASGPRLFLNAVAQNEFATKS